MGLTIIAPNLEVKYEKPQIVALMGVRNSSGVNIKITLNRAAKPNVERKMKILLRKGDETIKYKRNAVAPRKEPACITNIRPNISAIHPDDNSLSISPVKAKILSAKKSPPI